MTDSRHDFVYDIAPTDHVAFAGSVAVLASVTALASYIPARRAARLDPLVALRSE